MIFGFIENSCLKQINNLGKSYFRRQFCTLPKSYNVLFFGTDEFSLESLQKLQDAKNTRLVNSLEIVTSDKSLSAVKKFAAQYELPVHSWPCEVPKAKFDIGIVASFGHLIPEKIISSFPWGMINVHASLLPKLRGAAPIIHTILNGDTITGVTIMKIEPKRFDIGNILLQKSFEIPEDITSKKLTKILAKLGSELLIECLHNLPENLAKSSPQDPTLATKAPKVTPKLALVNWQSEASFIHRQYRAVSEFHKLHSFWNETPVKFDQMISPQLTNILNIPKLLSMSKLNTILTHPGHIYIHRKRNILCVLCKDDWVGFQQITVQGYKHMTPLDFYNGFLSKTDKTKWKFENIESTRKS